MKIIRLALVVGGLVLSAGIMPAQVRTDNNDYRP